MVERQTEIVGVILAAGKGTRMEPFSMHYPKPILPVCNKPLLYYQIELMKALGIERIIIVIGHLGHEITRSFGNGDCLGPKIEYIEQRETLGIAHALGKLEPHISSPMLLSLGDIFLVTENIESMKEKMTDDDAGAVLAIKHEEDPDAIKRNFTVTLDDNGIVKRVIEKPRHVNTPIKGCGLYLFTQHVFDAIRRTPRTAMRDEYEITDTIQIIIDDGYPVMTADVVKWDMNVTYPADVLKCNLVELKRRGKDTIIGKAAKIHPKAVIHGSVIGDNVVVEHPIKITNAVIFPDTVVTAEHDIDRFIVTPEEHIDCRQIVQRD